MRNAYELVVLLHPDLEIDVEAPIAKVESLIDAVGGKVTKRDNWGKKRLAYKIKRQDFAIYVYFEVELDPTTVRQLENTILITEEVLRHLLVAHEENKENKPRAGVKKAVDKAADKAADKAEMADKSEIADKAEKADKAETIENAHEELVATAATKAEEGTN